MLTCQKHLFSLPDDVHYLNCAYMSPLARRVEHVLPGRNAAPGSLFPVEDVLFSGVLYEVAARMATADGHAAEAGDVPGESAIETTENPVSVRGFLEHF